MKKLFVVVIAILTIAMMFAGCRAERAQGNTLNITAESSEPPESDLLITLYEPRLIEPASYDDLEREGDFEFEVPEFPGVTFKQTENCLLAIEPERERILFGNKPVKVSDEWRKMNRIGPVYLADLNGDRLPEFCTTIINGLEGVSSVSQSIAVYDYANAKRYGMKYQSTQKGKSDYSLSLEGGSLMATGTRIEYGNDSNISTKTRELFIVDDRLSVSNPKEFIPGYVPDDSGLLSDILTREYSLEELRAFFWDGCPNDLHMNNVDKNFPIECLRLESYVVYKVSEGGYFYVFWLLTGPADGNVWPFSAFEDAAVHYTAYLAESSFKKAEDFGAIIVGKSTMRDVAQIDPNFELCLSLSSRLPSWSLLEDGSVMEICYDREMNDGMEGKDLIVKSKSVYPAGRTFSRLAKILKKDLP